MLDDTDYNVAGKGQEPGRKPRSRLDRPCDLCRRHKHLCAIEIKGQPCLGCKARNVTCTFDLPTTARKRKRPDPIAADMSSGTNQVLGNVETDSLSSSRRQHDLAWSPTAAISTNFSSSQSSTLGYPQQSIRTGSDLNSASIIFNKGLVGGFQSQHDGNLDENDIWSEQGAELPLNHHASLDMNENDGQESHFIGSGAISNFVHNPTSSFTVPQIYGILSFRQVSSDPALPVFFVKHPALLYGRTLNSSRAIYDKVCSLCEPYCQDISSKTLFTIQQMLLPALPIVNSKRLETSSLGHSGSGPIPYAILTGLIAHSTAYIPEIRAIHQDLWHRALLALDDEYRQPRLATLQLALLQLYSRPPERGENSGQLTIGLARAIGTAHLLGLHMDPTDWSLPRWEIRLRKRIWWSLVIQDKWRALLFGRPSYLHTATHTVQIPTMSDGDWGNLTSPTDRISMSTFIATCQLTIVVELAQVNLNLPPSALWVSSIGSSAEKYPTGVHSFHLSYLGLTVFIRRLILDSVSADMPLQAVSALSLAYQSCQEVIHMITSLTLSDQETYWAPYTSHHISNTVALLLRVAARSQVSVPEVYGNAINAVSSFVRLLTQRYHDNPWDVVGTALRRLASLLLLAYQDFPEIRDSYRDVAFVLHLPVIDDVQPQRTGIPPLEHEELELISQLINDPDWLTALGLWNDS
ncbi:uncharacterized protein IL334_001372 [Kwoniella shivajii]|uniref:Zn(2)-C6 fungal-type domain-containing protein n=1 Tax=Kwoniella shivajii TaxID=564305 RepID=A0ABZ1CS38_9TREE|nr:hypothetical protein IL334_001372 [Kwoniella shivajii]